MARRMLRSHARRHLVLLRVTPHVPVAGAATARASLATYHDRYETARPPHGLMHGLVAGESTPHRIHVD